MADVFVSYSRQDEAKARAISQALKQRGFSVWMDLELLPGEEFSRAIQRVIGSAGAVVVLWSPHSVESDWVLAEANLARQRKRVVPVLLEQVEIPLPFSMIHAADLRNWDGSAGHPGFAMLEAGVRQCLAMPPAEPPVPPRSKFRAPAAIAAAVVLLAAAAFFAVSRRGPRAGDTRLNERDGLTYVWVPPGEFMLGCSPGDSECRPEEKPAHKVEVAGFWLGQTEVTQAAWTRVVKTDPSKFKGADRPVEQVSWQDASAYCAQAGGRLPTEAEWEYAARAGSRAATPGPIGQVAWYAANGDGTTHPVRTKAQNAWGLHDMLGNVWEWTADWFGDYLPDAQSNPVGPARGTSKVMRGGSWHNYDGIVRVSYRDADARENTSAEVGFRCAFARR